MSGWVAQLGTREGRCSWLSCTPSPGCVVDLGQGHVSKACAVGELEVEGDVRVRALCPVLVPGPPCGEPAVDDAGVHRTLLGGVDDEACNVLADAPRHDGGRFFDGVGVRRRSDVSGVGGGVVERDPDRPGLRGTSVAVDLCGDASTGLLAAPAPGQARRLLPSRAFPHDQCVVPALLDSAPSAYASWTALPTGVPVSADSPAATWCHQRWEQDATTTNT